MRQRISPRLRRFRRVVSLLAVVLVSIGMGGMVAAVAGSTGLVPGQSLSSGQALASPSGQYKLTMQTDGNLVLRTSTRVVWNAGTSTAGSSLQFSSAGALAVISPGGASLWQAGVTGATSLQVDDSGMVALYRSSTVLWSAVGTSIRAGERLSPGEQLFSPDRRYRLQMQTDGNLVLRSPTSAAVWNSNTARHPGAYLLLQTDGNLVVYSADGHALYSARTNGAGASVVLSIISVGAAQLTRGSQVLWSTAGATLLPGQILAAGSTVCTGTRSVCLFMQTDGNLVLRRGTTVRWNTRTYNHAGARAQMQTDGNFVVYSAQNAVLFQSETSHHPGAELTVTAAGDAIVAAAGQSLWTALGGSVAAARAAATAVAYGQSRGERVAVAVYDRLRGRMYVAGDPDGYFASASVMKVFIATRLLVSGQAGNPSIAAQMWRMITLSDDNAANYLYGVAGGAGVVSWAAARYHISGLAPTPDPSYWGLSRITARAMASYYQAVALDPVVEPWLLNAMAHMTVPAADGWPQGFGIPSVTSGWRVKQGWMCCLDNRTRMHSTGYVNHDRYTVAILTEGPTGDYSQFGRDTVTGMAARLLPGGNMPV